MPINHACSARDTIHHTSGLIQLCFFRSSIEFIQEMLEADLSSLAAMKQELALLPEGTLYIRNHREGFRFTRRDRNNKKESPIGKRPEIIHKLARRTFLEQRIADIESRTQQLKDLSDLSLEAINIQKQKAKLQRYANAGLDLSRILFTKEQNEWIDEVYTPNPFYSDDLIYPTAGGVLMRSLSETLIANTLETIGLPYRYDDLVRIGAGLPGSRGAKPNRNNYFADFKVPNLIGGITVHEHLGAFQISNYAQNALQRLNDYHNFTICELPGRPVKDEEITWSFENNVIEPHLLQRLVRRLLLPFPL